MVNHSQVRFLLTMRALHQVNYKLHTTLVPVLRIKQSQLDGVLHLTWEDAQFSDISCL
jgi:hypothetical protein